MPPFEVAATDPADGARIGFVPTQLKVDFSDGVLLTTLQASDVTIDNIPASAYAIIDGNTAIFELPEPLSAGPHSVAVAAGAVLDLRGASVEAYVGQFVIDLTGPQVTNVRVNARNGRGISSIEPGMAGIRTIEITFSESVVFAESAVSVQSVSFDGTEETVTAVLVPLVAGSGTDRMILAFMDVHVVNTWVKAILGGGVADLAGNPLDGEAPPEGSGNGYLYDASLDLPSGDGTSGGEATFYVGSLQGDATVDGLVAQDDLDTVLGLWGHSVPPADVDGDGLVGQTDLDIVLGDWGDSPPADPRADTNGDSFVGQADLEMVLANWGSRPGAGDMSGDGFVGSADLDAILYNWGRSLSPLPPAGLGQGESVSGMSPPAGFAALQQRQLESHSDEQSATALSGAAAPEVSSMVLSTDCIVIDLLAHRPVLWRSGAKADAARGPEAVSSMPEAPARLSWLLPPWARNRPTVVRAWQNLRSLPGTSRRVRPAHLKRLSSALGDVLVDSYRLRRITASPLSASRESVAGSGM